MEVLHLTLKKKWFGMILAGVKTEEYREIKKYWFKRLWLKSFTRIRFVNGYGKNRPAFTIAVKRVSIDTGKKEWGAEPNKKYYRIELGEIISANCFAYPLK